MQILLLLIFLKTVNDIYCDSFPLKVKKISKKRLSKPWLTPEILKHVKYKSLCFKKCKLGLISDADNRKVRNFVNSMVHKARVGYHRDRFQGSMGDMKRTWIYLRKLVSFGGSKQTVDLVNNGDIVVSNPRDIAQCFNDHFCSVASVISDSLPASTVDPLSYVKHNVHSLFFDPVSREEVSEIISSLRNTKYDLDTISVKMLKFCNRILNYPLSLIINKSLSAGIFPDVFKDACVIPIYKKGDKTNVNNYRPISILPLFGKVLEKCVARRLVSFADHCSIICDNQFGFRKGLSTVDAIVDYSEYICRNLEEHKHVIGVFIDYSKAFDTVNHSILLSKLEAYGIRGLALDWFRSYLDNRRQCVRVGSSYSDYGSISFGVPQGSVLGPVLFVLFVNDIANVSAILKTILFADDTTVSAAGSNFHELCNIVDSELEVVTSWSISNKLSLNPDKTGAILFSNRLHDVDLVRGLNVNNVMINFVDSVSFLGLTIDCKLKFKDHIGVVSKKLSKVVGIMYKVREYLTVKSLTSLYYSLFYPYLLYGNVLWGGTYNVHLHTVEMLQKRAVRIITGSEYLAHTDPLFYSTGILKIDDLHEYLLLLYLFKSKNKFNYSNSTYETRHASDPEIIHHRLTLTEHSVHYSAAKLWHSLPSHIKAINSYNLFKTTLKKYYVIRYAG